MKPNNKHTPGPWKVEKYPYDKIFICRKRGFKNSVIAEIGNNFENENNKANAALIAAAPEMLEALMKIYTKLCSEQFQYLQNDFENELINIEKAIQKARGE